MTIERQCRWVTQKFRGVDFCRGALCDDGHGAAPPDPCRLIILPYVTALGDDEKGKNLGISSFNTTHPALTFIPSAKSQRHPLLGQLNQWIVCGSYQFSEIKMAEASSTTAGKEHGR